MNIKIRINKIFLSLASVLIFATGQAKDFPGLPGLEDSKFLKIQGSIIKGRYQAPKNVFSCQAYDFNEGKYRSQDLLMDEAACVAFYSFYGNFKKAEIMFMPGQKKNLDKEALKDAFDRLGLGILKTVDDAQDIEILKEEIIDESMLFVAISVGKTSFLRGPNGKHMSSTRGYLVFQEEDKLVLLSNQEVTLPWEKHIPKEHIDTLKSDILDFKKTFKFGPIPPKEPLANPGRDIIVNIKNKTKLKNIISIQIPNKFVPLNDVSIDGEMFCEFIPEGENPLFWSEIIAIMQIPSSGTMAQFLKNMKGCYKGKNERFSYTLAEDHGFKTAYLIAEYPASLPNPSQSTNSVKIPGKNEICMTKAVQDVDGFVSIQYSTRYDIKSSSEAKELIKEKMLKFLQSCEIKVDHIP